jgi:hypothetical protein
VTAEGFLLGEIEEVQERSARSFGHRGVNQGQGAARRAGRRPFLELFGRLSHSSCDLNCRAVPSLPSRSNTTDTLPRTRVNQRDYAVVILFSSTTETAAIVGFLQQQSRCQSLLLYPDNHHPPSNPPSRLQLR